MSTVIAAVALSVQVTWAKEESRERVDEPRERATEPNLRVVRYVLQSQVPAVDTVTSPPLYDFTYRLVIANDGASLSGARGLLTSRLTSVSVLSGTVDVGPIAAGVQVSPTVTVSLRAATAPDLAVLAGGRSARRDSRDQEADREGRMTRNEMPFTDEERKAPLAWHWTALPSHAGPVVELLTPQRRVNAGSALILRAVYAPSQAPILTSKVRLSVDGQDVSAGTSVRANDLSYAPAVPLREGRHEAVLTVADTDGRATEARWSFEVETPDDAHRPLAISGLSPDDGVRVAGKPAPTIAATLSTADATRTGRKLRVVVDGRDVTADCQQTAGSVSYTPAEPLGDGVHRVEVSLGGDDDHRLASRTWHFVSYTPLAISEVTPDAVATLNPSTPIRAKYEGTRVNASRFTLTLDGSDVTSQAEFARGMLNLLPARPLSAGLHAVRLVISDGNGASEHADWSFSIVKLPVTPPASPGDTPSGTPTDPIQTLRVAP